MDLKVSKKKISKLAINQDNVINPEQCTNLKGGACCTRNRSRRWRGWWNN